MIDCGSTEDIISLFKQLIVDADCEPAVECDSVDWLSLLKQTLYTDGTDVLINLVDCDG